MYKAFLIKYGEIGVKGKNRYLFEDALVRQIRFALEKVEGEFVVSKENGRIYATAQTEFDYDEAVEALKTVFGIIGICPVVQIEDNGFDDLAEHVIKYIDEAYPDKNVTFKVDARRARKNYPMNSMEINMEMGGRILDAFPEMKALTAIVAAALLAHSVRQVQSTALGACNETGDSQLPGGAASLIASCFGYFSLRYCHCDTSLIYKGQAALFILYLFSKSFARTARRGSTSFLQEQGPRFRSAPQRGQSPLQSSEHRVFVSMSRIKASRANSPTSTLPSSSRRISSSSSFCNSSARIQP